jgi:hypothetical protein
MPKDRDFPAMMYGPNGEQRVFQRGEQVPAGWQDHHFPNEEEAKRRTIHPANIPANDGKETVRRGGRGKGATQPSSKATGSNTDARDNDAEEVLTREEAIKQLTDANVEVPEGATDAEIEQLLVKLEG